MIDCDRGVCVCAPARVLFLFGKKQQQQQNQYFNRLPPLTYNNQINLKEKSTNINNTINSDLQSTDDQFSNALKNVQNFLTLTHDDG